MEKENGNYYIGFRVLRFRDEGSGLRDYLGLGFRDYD